MSLGADLSQRLRALLLRGRVERELDEELRDHIERDTADRIRLGADPVVARRAALLALGGVEQTKEQVRDARGLRGLEELGADLRYALRSLRRRPGFTLTVLLVLGLAIGASTAVLALIRVAFVTALPYPAADRLVRVYQQNSPTNRWSLATVDVQGIHQHARSLAAFGQVQLTEAALTGVGAPARIRIGRASAGFFEVLQLAAASGRLIEPGDEAAGAPPVAVISNRMALESFGSPEAAIGRALVIDGVSHGVVGVLPPGYDRIAGFTAPVWPALRLTPPTRRGPFWLQGIGRLREGASLASARSDLAEVSRAIFPEWATSFRDSTARLTPVLLRQAILGDGARRLVLLGIAVALVWLAAVANVATLLLVRTLSRERELAVRAALGAGRGRVARLVTLEGVVLAAAAGALGIAIAWILVRSGATVPADVRLPGELDPGAAILGGVLLSLLTAMQVILPTVWPVLSRAGAGALHGDSRRTGAGRGTVRLRTALVGTEFALALPLLLGAGLLLNSFMRLQRVDPGYDPDGVTVVRLSLPSARYPDFPQTQAFWSRLETRLAEVPGVTAVGFSGGLPPDEPDDFNNFDLIDHPVPSGTAEPVSPWSTVSTGYFVALGIRLLEGRLFTAADTGAAAPVVVVSRAWANRYFPEGRPIGRQLIAGGCTTCPRTTVIGVVGDVKYQGLAGSGEAVYQPSGQAQPRNLYLVVSGRLPEREMTATVAAEIARLDPELPAAPQPLLRQLQGSLVEPRRWALTVGGFAAAAVTLAALGVFGLMSFLVGQRRREIGVRLALGADPAAIIRLIVGQGLWIALAGAVAGLMIAAFAARWLEQLLFGIGVWDAVTVGSVVFLLVSIALFSSWLPARHAARIRPTEALASE